MMREKCTEKGRHNMPDNKRYTPQASMGGCKITLLGECKITLLGGGHSSRSVGRTFRGKRKKSTRGLHISKKSSTFAAKFG